MSRRTVAALYERRTNNAAVIDRRYKVSGESADRILLDCVFGNKRDTQLPDEYGGRGEIPVCNSGNDKRIAAENFSKRTANYDNALRQRFLNRNTLGAIRFHAARSVVDRLAIARANAPARVATSDQSRSSPRRVFDRSGR